MAFRFFKAFGMPPLSQILAIIGVFYWRLTMIDRVTHLDALGGKTRCPQLSKPRRSYRSELSVAVCLSSFLSVQ